MPKIKVKNLKFTTKKDLTSLLRSSEDTKGKYCILLNPHSVVAGSKSECFCKITNSKESLIFCDGIGMKLKNLRIERLTGIDFVRLVYANLPIGSKILWVGGTKEKNVNFEKNLKRSGLNGLKSIIVDLPIKESFDVQDIARIKNVVEEERPSVILVCIGAPKQEILMSELSTNSTRLIAGVGAVYDFIVTPNQQAPIWMSKIGVEWLYRLMKNPKRMWKRTLISAPIFLLYH